MSGSQSSQSNQGQTRNLARSADCGSTLRNASADAGISMMPGAVMPRGALGLKAALAASCCRNRGSGAGGVGGNWIPASASKPWIRPKISGSMLQLRASQGRHSRQHQRKVIVKLPLISVVALVISPRQHHHKKQSTS
jgi:hypothetical protein